MTALRPCWWAALSLAIVGYATAATSAPPTSERDCALKALAYEFGASRGVAVDRAALWTGLGLAACASAPRRPAGPPAPAPHATVPPAALRFFVSAAGNDAHAGTSAAAAFATLQRAQLAIRGCACRRSAPMCNATVTLGPGIYDLNETLRLDERDSRVAWMAQEPGTVKVTGSLRIPAANLMWVPWRNNVFKADLSAVLPPALKASLRAAAAQRPRSHAPRAWDYGRPPALVNQLFRDDARQTLARWPNGNPELESGLCLQAAAPHWGVVEGGCSAWVTPDGGVSEKQPSGTPRTKKLNNYPDCEMAHCVNRGLSPTWGCAECLECGTFGPYFVNDPPPGHPLYSRTGVQYGWHNTSLTAFWSDIFSRPGGVRSARAAERSLSRAWSNPEAGSVHMFHGALWGWWAFNIASISQASKQINFGYGGHQEARGWSVTGKSNFYVEGILEELDDALEWYFEPSTLTLFLHGRNSSNISGGSVSVGGGGWSPPSGEISIPLLTTLVSIASNRSTMVANPNHGASDTERVHGISLIGLEFTQTRSTYLSEPYEVPSAGDWSVVRSGSVFVENAHNITIERCRFNQTGGNALTLSAAVTDSTVRDSEFTRIGDSAIVLLGVADVDVGVLPTFPNRNLIEGNHVHNYGVYGKQVSAVFQALSANTTVRNNVMHGGPRAHINENDGMAGGSIIEGNLLFSSVRETADHGPVNSWNRMPYWTLNGVDDGFANWSNISKPHPLASAVKRFDHIRRNFIFADFGGSRALDHDDGSQLFRDEENVLVGAGVKNFLGNTKQFVSNLIVGAGERGICCYQSDGAAAIGHSNHVFANNTCLFTAGPGTGCGDHNVSGPYLSHCPAAGVEPSTAGWRASIQNSSFLSANNSYFSADEFHLRCPPYYLSLAQTQATTGEERGSSSGATPDVRDVVALARALLRM